MSEHYAVILCSGLVICLRSLSRTLRPTQLLALNGDKTLLQKIAARLTKYVISAHLFTVTYEDQKCEVERRLTKPFKDLHGLPIESTRVFA